MYHQNNNYMKSSLKAILLAFIVALSSCQSNDVVPQEKLEGTWNVQKVETESQVQGEQPRKETETFEGQTAQLTFLANGTFQAQNFLVPLPVDGASENTLTIEGTYKVEGNVTTLTFREPGETTNIQLLMTTDIRRNTMTLNMNKDQLFVTLDAFASADPLIGLVLNLYKTTLLQFNLTYTLSKG